MEGREKWMELSEKVWLGSLIHEHERVRRKEERDEKEEEERNDLGKARTWEQAEPKVPLDKY